jgi:hypothetical protein
MSGPYRKIRAPLSSESGVRRIRSRSASGFSSGRSRGDSFGSSSGGSLWSAGAFEGKVRLTCFILAGVLLAGAASVAGWILWGTRAVPSAAGPVVPGSTPAEWDGGTPQEVAERFLGAANFEERLRWVKNPDQVAPLVEDFYLDGPGRDERVAGIGLLTDVATRDGVLARFEVSMTDGSQRLLCLHYEGSGCGKIDFKCYARHCSQSWSDLLDGEIERADEMRVILEPYAYYNYDFRDEVSWISLFATSPDLPPEGIYLYAKRGAPGIPAGLEDPGFTPLQCTISIGTLGRGRLHRQFILDRVLHEGWFEP